MGKSDAKKEYKHFVPEAKIIPNWYTNFNFVLVTSMEQLDTIFKDANWSFNEKKSFMSLDTETTGLNFEELDIVGYSFCLDGKSTYYVPVNHFQYQYNLGDESCEYIYNRMCEAKQVFMYNARYDARVFEYMGYKERKEELDKIRWRYVKYDMSKVSIYEVMNSTWLGDTNTKLPSLKWSSEHYLGFKQMHFEEVIEQAGNFYYLNPSDNEDVKYYAGADALCTFLLVPATIKYFKEAGMAGQLDNLVIYPIMHYESEKLFIDYDRVCRMYEEAKDEVDRCEAEVYEAFGYQFNMNSSVQVAQALERLGIDTGERTSSGNMKTGMKDIESLPDEIKQKYPALKAYIKFKETSKLVNSYFSVYKKEAERCGYLRGSYKMHNVPTGRLSCSKDGKNTYFSPVNLQAIPKPHVMMYDVFDLGDRNLFVKKDNILLGYQFVPAKYDENKKHIIPTDPRYIGWAEGMDPHLNVRSCITPKMYSDSKDDDYFYCLDPESSFVETKELGYVPLAEVEKSMNSGNEVNIKTPYGYKKILHYMHTGTKKICRVSLKDGSEVICSSKHRFMTTNDEWKTVDELLPTDSIKVDETFLDTDNPWRTIPGYDDIYRVNVFTNEIYRTNKNGKEHLVPIIEDTRGYERVIISKDGKQRNYRLGRLIVSAYYGVENPFGYKIVDHIDSNPKNNDIRNLKPVTSRQNNNKMNIRLVSQEGELNPKAKLTDEQTAEIPKKFKELVDSGVGIDKSYYILAEQYGVSYSCIRWVVKYRKKRDIIYGTEDSNILGIMFTDDEMEMVDIEVEDVHCFYVNKMLSHNCACDYAAQELRITANLSREPAWMNAFIEGRDVHKSCYSLDTEFLTDSGFKVYTEISEDTLIAQYNDKSDSVEFVRAGKLYTNKTNSLYHFVGKNTDLMVTGNHRVYCRLDTEGMYSIRLAEDIFNIKLGVYIKDTYGNEDFVDNIECIDGNFDSVCYSVPTGLLVVRRNNKISVCGNTAIALWGEENYNKDYRKKAKGANFGILYGMGAASFANDPLYGNLSMAEAEEFYNHYKQALPTLFQWEDRKMRQGRREGTVYTFFHRPRRVRGYFDNGNASFANRTIINTQIQGCHLYDNKVLTNRGYRKIGELYDEFQTINQDMNLWDYKVWNGFKWCDFFPVERGRDFKYRLHFDNGQTVECDSRHLVKTFGNESIEWMNVNDLIEGESAVCFMRNSDKTCSIDIIESVVGDISYASKKYSTPIEFNRDDIKVLCYLYGVVLGDGHITYGYSKSDNEYRSRGRCGVAVYFGVNAKKKVDFEYIKSMLDKHSIYYYDKMKKGHISKSGTESEVGVFICDCKPLVDAIQKLTGDLSGNTWTKRIGDKVFTLDRELVQYVLKGIYDTDGIANDGGTKLVNKGLIEDIQLLMKYYGYDSVIMENDTSWKVMPHNYSFSYLNEIKGDSGYNGDFQQSILPYHRHLVEDLNPSAKHIGQSNYVVFNKLKHGGSCEVRTFRSIFGAMNTLDSSISIGEDYDYHIISEVEKTDEEVDTYTLCVLDDSHQYVCEGMISHNTASDLLKLVMCKLWKKLLNNPDYRDDVRFLITIHDEIGYSVKSSRANEIINMIEQTQRVKLDEWPVLIDVEASVGWSIGGLFAVHRVDDDSELGWHYEPKIDEE